MIIDSHWERESRLSLRSGPHRLTKIQKVTYSRIDGQHKLFLVGFTMQSWVGKNGEVNNLGEVMGGIGYYQGEL